MGKAELFKDLYPFKPKKITVFGHTISYLDEGKGPVIVMLHGNPTWSFFYRNLVLLLRDRYRLIVPDHLGCGFSDKPQEYPYRLKDHIDNLENLLGQLGVEKHSLVLHDWGGAIGMGYLDRHPERLESLTVLNTAAFRSTRIPLRINICRIPYLGPFLVRGLNGFVRAAVHMAVKKRMPRLVRKGYLAPYNSWANRVAVMRFIEDIPLDYRHPSWETLLRAEGALQYIKNKPVLILWGGKDFCFNNTFYQEWHRRFPHARSIYLENAGHFVLEDADGQVDHLINGFFDEYLGGGRG
ncbi:MAG: alpha/beta fold hydrolase [Proteobacteria bacterium]|nr:alpha/beta fold hydrolase [Pseudomonadota bacterium]MBU1738193.1 alpha/beta fold hydrolase [Pseudomonadota bacterium]